MNLVSFFDELEKISGSMPLLQRLHNIHAPMDVAGLGILAVPSVDDIIARHRAVKAGALKHGEPDVEKYRLIKEKWHAPIEVLGLGTLAAPTIAGRIAHGKW